MVVLCLVGKFSIMMMWCVVAGVVVVDRTSWLAGVLSLLSTDKEWIILGYGMLVCGLDCGNFFGKCSFCKRCICWYSGMLMVLYFYTAYMIIETCGECLNLLAKLQ